MYNDGAGGSLQQSLLSAARRWESEKQLSESRLRNQAEKANARANDLEKKLQSERVRIAELEQLVKEEANRATVQTQRADDLEKQVTASRLQTLGSFLLLGDVRGKLKGLSPRPAPAGHAALPNGTAEEKQIEAAEDEVAAAAAVAAESVLADEDDDESGVAGGEVAASKDTPAGKNAKKNAKKREKEKLAKAAANAEANGTSSAGRRD